MVSFWYGSKKSVFSLLYFLNRFPIYSIDRSNRGKANMQRKEHWIHAAELFSRELLCCANCVPARIGLHMY